MIFLFINSFVSFYILSLILKMGALKIQNEYFASTFILGLIYLGYSKGCKVMLQKSRDERIRMMGSAMVQIPFFGITLAFLIEMSPVIVRVFDGILTSKGIPLVGKEIVAASAFLSIARLGTLASIEMVGLYELYGKDKTQKVMALSYIGALFASLMAAFISFRQDQHLIHFAILMTVNIGVAVYFLPKVNFTKRSKIFLSIVLIFSSLLTYRTFRYGELFRNNSRAVLYSIDNGVSLPNPSERPLVQSITSPFQRIDIARFSGSKEYFQLYLNEDFQFDSDSHHLYHKMFVHGGLYFKNGQLPLKDILILGGGDGLLATEIIETLGPEVKVTMVELDPLVIETAKKSWAHLLSSKFNEQVHVVIADAFHYLRNNQEKFDAIYMDFPDPKSFDTSKLFSLEMYKLASKQLKTSGFLVVNYPSHKAFNINFSTLVAASFKNIVGFGDGNTFTYADLQENSDEFNNKLKTATFPINSKGRFDSSKVNSVFKPTLPELDLLNEVKSEFGWVF